MKGHGQGEAYSGYVGEGGVLVFHKHLFFFLLFILLLKDRGSKFKLSYLHKRTCCLKEGFF